jgi:hypothetical protein
MPTGWAVVIIIQWLAIAALTIVVLGVLRQITNRDERPGGMKMRVWPNVANVGTRLPAFTASLDGEKIDASMLVQGRSAVLMFLSAGCAPCRALTDEIAAAGLSAGLSGSLIAVLAPGTEHSLRISDQVQVLTMPDDESEQVLGIPGKPFAMAVDPDGLITAKRLINTLTQLEALAATAQEPAPA